MAVESPHGFDANPYAEDVATTFATYDCGASVLAPAAEIDDAPDRCPVCGARRVDR